MAFGVLLFHWEEAHESGLLNRHSTSTEIAMRLEAPMKGSNNPVLKTLDVTCDHVVDFGSPRWNKTLMVLELVNGLRAKLSDTVDSTLEGVLVIFHEYDDHIVGISARLFDVVREDVVRPGHQIIGVLIQSLDDRVLDNEIREIDSECIFDQGPARLATRRITPHINVRFKIRNHALIAGSRLDVHGLEK